ncbi:MAG TPA: PilX N-terminal domain-containing pilus assembly protein [Gammaproteobacteria bacterium]
MTTIRQTQQAGAALVVSLMMLLALTIISLSAVSNTNLEERMAHNFQQSVLVFQASESTIERVINLGDVGGAGVNANPFYDEVDDPLVTAINAGLNDTSTTISHDNDPNGYLANATLTSTATVSYIGTNACPETSLGELTCYAFDVTSTATIDATSTTETHIQTVDRPAPAAT